MNSFLVCFTGGKFIQFSARFLIALNRDGKVLVIRT
jgi:hypothetical protein